MGPLSDAPIDAVERAIRGKTVLITGGSGYLGRALVPRIQALGATEVRILSRTAAAVSGLVDVRPFFGDIRDARSVAGAVTGANVVFHLAALKSVEACEARPADALSTNVDGTRVVLESILHAPGVERFVLMSSDKAAGPASVYGMTKAIAERLVAEAQAVTDVQLLAVRSGSVWGSSGSVVENWRRTISSGGDIPVTDPTMSRFVVRAEEAVDLVLAAAASDSRGSIVTRRMSAYTVGDLAALLAELHRARVRIIGRRPGEKLHEDLITWAEAPYSELRGDLIVFTPGRRMRGVAPISSSEATRLDRSELQSLLLEARATAD